MEKRGNNLQEKVPDSLREQNYLIEVKKVKKDFTGFALQEISFNLKKGDIMGFIGPNGAGKTTTIKLLMNLLRKDGGEIKLFNQDHLRHEREIKERLGFVYDNQDFYDELKVREAEKIVAPFYRNWDSKAYAQYLNDFELPHTKKIKDFSKGMKMKFSLAIALSHQAELLIMDEPTSGLDPVFRQEFLDLIRDFMDEQKGVLFSTHITSDLDKIADYVTFINQGRIVFSSSREKIFEDYGMVRGEKKHLQPELCSHLIGLREGNFGFEALTAEAALLHRNYSEIMVTPPTLEEIMLYLVKGAKRDV
jgi:ABC-2 type transport system ATP-binding protein